MKALLLSKKFKDGEPISEYIKTLAEKLVTQGHQATIISFDDKSYYSMHEEVEVKRVPLKFEGDNIYNWSMILNNELKREATDILQQKGEEFDIIHANEWTTIPGGATLSQHTEKPYILTLHSTENQRGFQDPNSEIISELEYQGVQESQHIITPCEDTKNSILFDLSAEDNKVTATRPEPEDWAETVLNKYKETIKQKEKVKN